MVSKAEYVSDFADYTGESSINKKKKFPESESKS